MKKQILLLFAICLMTGCNNWLNLKPEDERVNEQYWTSKEDVQTTLLSCYNRFRNCLPYFMVWGELRADNLNVNSLDATADMELIHGQNITSENDWVEWTPFYRVINSANAVIKYASLVLERDPLYTETEMKYHLAEAKGLRALAYYYLVRAFREVPLVTEPFDSDEQGFTMAKSSEQAIWDQIVADLRDALAAPTSYAYTSSEYWQNTCRLTNWGAATILAEVYLWTGEYALSKELCELIISGGRYELQTDWYDIFYPGMTDESIFELYYDQANAQTNSLFAWFNHGNTNRYFNINSNVPTVLFADDEDIRGEGSSFVAAKSCVWKYVGNGVANTDANNTRPNTNRSANWIFYRYADVWLIHAEACAMLAVPDYTAAVSSLNEVRSRAGVAALPTEDSYTQESFLTLLLEERSKEFIAEGKRWFDLLRLARIDNFSKFKTLVVNILLKNISLNERPIYQTKLSKEGSFYFPIHKDEIDMSGGLLKQNEAYQ